jgi:hypothetical protein
MRQLAVIVVLFSIGSFSSSALAVDEAVLRDQESVNPVQTDPSAAIEAGIHDSASHPHPKEMPGTREASSLEPVCPPGQHFNGEHCVCPERMHWNGESCEPIGGAESGRDDGGEATPINLPAMPDDGGEATPINLP